ncbi:hypothetical protein BS17DRAFT_774808 [Gyrodon lividus]|nr:hypothetical protein BS17DRAFT_774808 [Gyrodon lividus]
MSENTQCVMMRTTFRPVDMVFGIMGLFGVILPVLDFRRDDRVGATVALARKILESGQSANWLGIAFRLPPCRYLSTFPIFPFSDEAGKALVRTVSGMKEVAEFMECEYPIADALKVTMPTGSMDDMGYLTFSGKYVCVACRDQLTLVSTVTAGGLQHPWHDIKGIDGTDWIITSTGTSPIVVSDAYAVLIGWFDEYSGRDARAQQILDQADACPGTRAWGVSCCLLRRDGGEAQRWAGRCGCLLSEGLIRCRRGIMITVPVLRLV